MEPREKENNRPLHKKISIFNLICAIVSITLAAYLLIPRIFSRPESDEDKPPGGK